MGIIGGSAGALKKVTFLWVGDGEDRWAGGWTAGE